MTRKVTALPFADAEPGHCRLCGVAILRKDGQPARNRRWCDSHQLEAKVIGSPLRARAAVFQRDRGICRACATDCTSYYQSCRFSENLEGVYRVQINREKALEWCERILTISTRHTIFPIDLGEWHVDHAMPLHLVDRSKPDAWKYWTLENLRTRCPECHKAKTAQEAKDRGKVRRLNGQTKRKPKQKIAQPANPWPAKGARKLQGRKFRKAT